MPRLNNKSQVEPAESSSAAAGSDVENSDQWVRSNEVRKALKISTCDLAHMREAGKIESKKVGNAFLYKLPSRIEEQ